MKTSNGLSAGHESSTKYGKFHSLPMSHITQAHLTITLGDRPLSGYLQ